MLLPCYIGEILSRPLRQNIFTTPNEGEEKKNMSLSQTEIVGMASEIVTLLEHEKEKIARLGIDAERLIRDLKQLLGETVESNAEQESFKTRAQEATKRTVRLSHELHVKASGTLDIIIGAYGKDSIDSSVIRRIRSRIRRPGNHEDAEGESSPEAVQ